MYVGRYSLVRLDQSFGAEERFVDPAKCLTSSRINPDMRAQTGDGDR